MDNTTIARCTKIIKGAFMLFMQNGTLKNQQKLLSSLNSLILYMGVKFNLTNEDRESLLKVFWGEYNKGCRNKMSDQYINDVLIPAVFIDGNTDPALGMSILITVENSL